MKTIKRIVLFTLVLVILGLFAACPDPNETDPGSEVEPGTIIVSGKSLADKLAWLKTNAERDSSYIIEITSVYEELAPQIISYPGRNNITIKLKGIGIGRVIGLSNDGWLFTVGDGVTLTLEENLILSDPVKINSGGTLIMNQSVKITGKSSYVYMEGGTFTMNGGEISGNSYVGVFISDGTFTMSGGEISGNSASGVLSDGTFTMSGGEISGNSGSGVNVSDGTFTMSGGEISGNSASGVYVSDGTFTMNGGEISGNSSSCGGGVIVRDGTFEKTGGTIYGYTAGDSKSNVVYDSGVVKNDRGHAVYATYVRNTNYIKRKESTAGPTDNLSYNGKLYPPIWDGAWDF